MKNILFLFLLMLSCCLNAGVFDVYKEEGILKPAQAWERPKDWPSIENPPTNTIRLLVADVGQATSAFKTVVASGGTSTVNWGDGTVTTGIASDALAEHTYTVGSGVSCSRGYTTFIITITATQNITRWYVQPSVVLKSIIRTNYLDAEFNTPSLNSGVGMFFTASYCYTTMLEHWRGVSAMPSLVDATTMFHNCSRLRTVDLSKMPELIVATSMFTGCTSLENIDLSKQTKLTVVAGAFSSSGLRAVDLSKSPLITDISSAFGTCFYLRNVNVTGLTMVTNSAGAFTYCPALTGITGLSTLGQSAVSMDAATAFENCELLTSIDLSNTKLTIFSAKGTVGRLNRLTSVLFHASSTFSSGTSPQFNITYCSFSAAQLNTLFTSLPTVVGKTIAITGCPGAGTCDQSIATGKGWTVTN